MQRETKKGPAHEYMISQSEDHAWGRGALRDFGPSSMQRRLRRPKPQTLGYAGEDTPSKPAQKAERSEKKPTISLTEEEIPANELHNLLK